MFESVLVVLSALVVLTLNSAAEVSAVCAANHEIHAKHAREEEKVATESVYRYVDKATEERVATDQDNISHSIYRYVDKATWDQHLRRVEQLVKRKDEEDKEREMEFLKRQANHAEAWQRASGSAEALQRAPGSNNEWFKPPSFK